MGVHIQSRRPEVARYAVSVAVLHDLQLTAATSRRLTVFPREERKRTDARESRWQSATNAPL